MTEPEQPRLYTRQEAVILGRRSICEGGIEGHLISRSTPYRVANFNGETVVNIYGCANCDVQVALSYPPLPGDTLE